MNQPAEPTAAPLRARIVDRVIATALAVAILALVGFVLAYAMALIVVKLGIGGPNLFVAAPLITVASLAWATSAGARPLATRRLEAAIAAALAAGTIWLAQPGHPAKLLQRSSEVTDVELRGDDAKITLATTTRLTRMPPVGRLLALNFILAALAVAGSALGRCLTQRPARLEDDGDELP